MKIGSYFLYLYALLYELTVLTNANTVRYVCLA